MAYQVDVQTHSVINSITINNNYNGLGVDYKGTKAFVSLNTNASALINFSTSASTIFSQTKTPRWIENSSDDNYVIAGNNPISIISYKTESVISQYFGQHQQNGAVSPVLSKIASVDNVISEMVYCYDYTNPNIITMNGYSTTGKYPEGDAPHRVEFTHTGEKAVFLNPMSKNIGVIDIRTNTLDTLIDVGSNCYDLKVTSDSKWAVIPEPSENLVHIIDFENFNVASVLPVGDYPITVSISPNDSFAYVGNIASNTITVVELDGSQSTILTEINIGDIGWIGTRKGYGSDVCPNPSGDYILVAASFSDMVQVVDTDSWSVVANLPVGDFPMIIEFIDNTSYAVVLNYFDNTYSLLYIDGSLSIVVNTFSTGGQFPVDLEYCSSTIELSIINYDSKNLVRLNPFTGIVSSVQDLSGYGSPVQLRLDKNGHPIDLTNNSNYLITNDSVYPLIGSASFINYSSEANIAAVTIPGPDAISIVEFEAFNISVRAFLEGPFVSTEMVANLNENNLPLNQPFNCNPWNYKGNEHVSVIPNTEIVDWVMLEIRETDGDSSSATSDKIIDRKAGFILKNGNIVSANGYDLIKFNEEINNNLYVIVWQRNHLPIMSANSLFLNKNTYQYDFTSNPDNVFGGISAIKELDTDYWGMISGDANADGLIDVQDIIINWYDHAGKSGYFNSDFNLDNQIDNKDKNSIWLPNKGFSSVIPE